VKLKSQSKCFGGTQSFYEHASKSLGTMSYGVYMPPSPRKVLYVLAGLECNEQTFAMKAGAQRLAAELGLVVVTPDTSPRTVRFPGDDASWDFGIAASFYLDATRVPWAMESYIIDEIAVLPDLPRGIMGHSMGGHGALTLALNHPERFESVSAIAPISSPSQVPWGQKAFAGFLGEDRAAWARYDATELVKAGKRVAPIRIDQGTSDKFLDTQLKPEVFAKACKEAGQPLQLVEHVGYDHGYYFISTVVEAQLRHHV
jgi:S-formylglutathione hydrolase